MRGSWMLWLLAVATVALSHGPSVLFELSASTLTVSDRLNVSVKVLEPSAGTFTLSGGSYTARPIYTQSGSANFSIPPGVLAIGLPELQASFAPLNGDRPTQGTTMVAVKAASATPLSSLSVLTSRNLTTNGNPFGFLPYPGGLIVSVGADGGKSENGLAVFTGANPAELMLKCMQGTDNAPGSGLGLAQTPNGSGLVLATDTGIILYDRQAVVSGCSATPIYIAQPQGAATFDISVSADGRYVFLANEFGRTAAGYDGQQANGNVGVVQLEYNAAGTLVGGRSLGGISTGGSSLPGVTVSHDGQYIYATTESALSDTKFAGAQNPILSHDDCAQVAGEPPVLNGILTVIDAQTLIASPNSTAAIIAVVAAGCSPVRAIESSDGNVVWVTARGDDRVLAFSKWGLLANPNNALIGYGNTGGAAPVDAALFAGDALLAVTNSNRFAFPIQAGNISILSAVPVAPKVLTTLPAYDFPRQVAVATDDTTLFVSDNESGVVQVISTSLF